MITVQAPTAVPLSYVKPVLEQLENFGYSRPKVFLQAGLDARSTRTSLPVLEFARLYGCATRLLESLTSRRLDRSLMTKEVTDLLCYCVISCEKLVDVVERAAAFNRVLGQMGGSIEAVRRGSTVELIIDSRRALRNPAALLVDLAAMNFYYQLLSWLIGKTIRLSGAHVMYPAPTNLLSMTELLGVPLTYDQPANLLVLPAHYLDEPVVRSGTELARCLQYFPFPFDIWMGTCVEDRLSDRVRVLLMEVLRNQQPPPTSLQVAQRLGVSSATLRRRLRDAGTGYAKMRAGCQRAWAEYLLTFTRVTVPEIAGQLGFGDDRAFRRAFSKWTGRSPAVFRSRTRRHAGAPAAAMHLNMGNSGG